MKGFFFNLINLFSHGFACQASIPMWTYRAMLLRGARMQVRKYAVIFPNIKPKNIVYPPTGLLVQRLEEGLDSVCSTKTTFFSPRGPTIFEAWRSASWQVCPSTSWWPSLKRHLFFFHFEISSFWNCPPCAHESNTLNITIRLAIWAAVTHINSTSPAERYFQHMNLFRILR